MFDTQSQPAVGAVQVLMFASFTTSPVASRHLIRSWNVKGVVLAGMLTQPENTYDRSPTMPPIACFVAPSAPSVAESLPAHAPLRTTSLLCVNLRVESHASGRPSASASI